MESRGESVGGEAQVEEIDQGSRARVDGRLNRTWQPGKCGVCGHKDRIRIEVLRASGASLDALAAQFDVSRDSVSRHFINHVSDRRRAELIAGPAQVEGLAAQAANESRSLLDYLRITRSVLFNQFLNAAEAGDRNGVVMTAKQLLDSLREVGKLTGELRDLSGLTINNNTVNFIGSPEFSRLSDGLLGIARVHPDAKSDILKLLRALETAPAGAGPALIEGRALEVAQ
jgi:hypothetical protein